VDPAMMGMLGGNASGHMDGAMRGGGLMGNASGNMDGDMRGGCPMGNASGNMDGAMRGGGPMGWGGRSVGMGNMGGGMQGSMQYAGRPNGGGMPPGPSTGLDPMGASQMQGGLGFGRPSSMNEPMQDARDRSRSPAFPSQFQRPGVNASPSLTIFAGNLQPAEDDWGKLLSMQKIQAQMERKAAPVYEQLAQGDPGNNDTMYAHIRTSLEDLFMVTIMETSLVFCVGCIQRLYNK
jgi:hypothetical protein